MNYLDAISPAGRRNLWAKRAVRVLCLALGLAVSAVLVAEIYFQQTFDSHFPHADRTYRILENFKSGEMSEAATVDGTPGGWAQGLKRSAPMVEAATRSTVQWGDGTLIHLDDGRTVQSSVALADSCFFDVFPQRILAGNAREVLSRKQYVMVSSEVAKAIGGNVVGRRFTIDYAPGFTFTIGGVFEAFPWNSSMHGEGMFLSLNTLSAFGHDGADGWIGNDRYRSFIRLAKGHKAEELVPYTRKALADHINKRELMKAGVELSMDITTPNEAYTSNPYVRQMTWILGIVAFVLLFSSVMNYLLIVVGNMVRRSREMAVRKCYGAEPHDIYGLVFREAAADVLWAVLLAAAIIFVCKGTVEAFISTPVSALFGLPLLWIGLGVGIVLVLFVAALVPGWLYNRTPVSVAFRGFDANRHRWKLGLLAVEFAVVGLMLSLLWVISSQYRKMTSLDPGYDYHSVALLTVDGLDSNQRMQCLTEVGRMPQVMMTSSASCLPIEGWFGSGNDVLLALGDKVLFNAEDFYFVGKDFFRLFAIPLEEGRIPTAGPAISASDITRGRTLLVDETFARKLRHAAHWKDGVVGKRIFVSEHCNEQYPTVTIVGVFRNIRIGSVSQSASVLRRPSMMFYGGDAVMPDMLLKFNDLTAETMRQVRDKVSRMYPGKNASLVSYATEYEKQYIMERNFRNGILIGGIVVFIIALFGLVGYTSDEVNRRSKEVAIRKVNGARVGDILRLFIKDIVKTAVPGIVVGCVGAWLIAAQWLQSFSERITLTPWPFLCVTVAILAVITAAVSINCWRIANSNPVNYLKDE